MKKQTLWNCETGFGFLTLKVRNQVLTDRDVQFLKETTAWAASELW
jgi:hypothetical protein